MEFSEKKSFAVIMNYSIYFFSEKNSKFTSTYDISDQGNYLKNHDNVTGIGLTMNED